MKTIPIKLPVKYGVFDVKDADGQVLFETNMCLDHQRATAEYIALCINEHERLTARVERYRAALEQ